MQVRSAEGFQMAIYHCSVKSISRGAGQSIVASAAYRHACKLEDARTGEIHDYSKKGGLESSEIFLPSGVKPLWAQDRAQLWNAAEVAETRKNSRVGREVVLALPDELTAHQRQELAWEMARHLADRYGVAVDVAIHKPSRNGDQRNHHAHMLMSVRQVTTEGFGKKVRVMDDREQGPKEVEHIRSEWAHLANVALERAGKNVQIDHRSFQRLGVDRMPTIHMGPAATGMQRRGEPTRLGERNLVAAEINARLMELEHELYEYQGRQKKIVEERTETPLERAKVLQNEEVQSGVARMKRLAKEWRKEQALAAERAKQQERERQREVERKAQEEKERIAKEMAKQREVNRNRGPSFER